MSIKKSIKKAWKQIIRNSSVRDGIGRAASSIGALLLATVTKRFPRR
jgi:hypothetical protein